MKHFHIGFTEVKTPLNKHLLPVIDFSISILKQSDNVYA